MNADSNKYSLLGLRKQNNYRAMYLHHDDVIKWEHSMCYCPFVRENHRSPVNSPHKDQWRGALMFSLIHAWINGWVNNGEAGDLRRNGAHYDVTVMMKLNHSGNIRDTFTTDTLVWFTHLQRRPPYIPDGKLIIKTRVKIPFPICSIVFTVKVTKYTD